jgi:hypothetical protein
MWGVISSEPHGDAFEAFSRSFSYTFGRPLHYLFYVVLATVFGGLCWLVVYHVAELVIWVSRLPAEFGAGPARWSTVSVLIGQPASGSAEVAGGWLIGSFESVVRTIATGFLQLLLVSGAAVYLLLRRDVDQTEFDEVFVEREDRRYELPELPRCQRRQGRVARRGASADGAAGQTDHDPRSRLDEALHRSQVGAGGGARGDLVRCRSGSSRWFAGAQRSRQDHRVADPEHHVASHVGRGHGQRVRCPDASSAGPAADRCRFGQYGDLRSDDGLGVGRAFRAFVRDGPPVASGADGIACSTACRCRPSATSWEPRCRPA